MGATQLRELARSRTWLGGLGLSGVASLLHAGALVLAPVAIIHPIGVLSVPIAVLAAAAHEPARRRGGGRCRGLSAGRDGFVALANTALTRSPTPRFAGALAVALRRGLTAGSRWALAAGGVAAL